MKIFTAFLLWPLAEIALFVLIGGEIGLWATLFWVMLTALLGVAVMRAQAAKQAIALREGLRGMRNPAQMAAGGILTFFAAGLLILPGFLTDFIGILLLLPPVQALFGAWILSKITVVQAAQPSQGWPRGAEEPQAGRNGADGPVVIDGDFIEVTPNEPRQKPSGWTQID